MDMRKLVGRNFARLRREKGLTQEEVEARSGFSQQYLSSLERGRRNPTVITLYELAHALGRQSPRTGQTRRKQGLIGRSREDHASLRGQLSGRPIMGSEKPAEQSIMRHRARCGRCGQVVNANSPSLVPSRGALQPR